MLVYVLYYVQVFLVMLLYYALIVIFVLISLFGVFDDPGPSCGGASGPAGRPCPGSPARGCAPIYHSRSCQVILCHDISCYITITHRIMTLYDIV